MSTPSVTRWTAAQYEEAAQRYCESLPLEHFMERTTQHTQSAATTEGFTVLKVLVPRVHLFGELLVQYFHEGQLCQVVPDNMIVIGDVSEEERGSWAVELEPAPIFMTMEYVSPSNRRKDYVDSHEKYESHLKVPYYLTVDHERDDLRLRRHDGEHYVLVPVNANGRHPIPEFELEVAWLGGWARFWHRGTLLPITRELDEQLRAARQELNERDAQIRKRDEQIRKRDEQAAAIVQALRPLVETRARQAGRQDILDQLPATTDGAQLTGWLAELG